MREYEIRLSTIEAVRSFVNAVSLYDFDVDLSSGRYIVDAKSIMGIFSLDLLNSLKMTVYSDDCEDFVKKIEAFIERAL